MIIEILIGIGLAIGLYWLQDRTSKDVKKMTERIDKLTQQKARAEQDKKAFECRKIIEHLQVIQDAERSLKTFLTGYKIGDHTNETLKSIYGMSLDGIAINRINKMKDGIE